MLQFTTYPVLFSGGLDQKTSEQLVVPGKFLVLENCVRRKIGKIQKRFGFTELSRQITSTSDSITSGERLARFRDDLVMFTEDSMYSYSSSNDEWVDKGAVTSTLVDSEPLMRNSFIQALPDLVSSEGVTVGAWEDSRGGVRCAVYDDTTGASILYDTVVSDSGSRPKVVAVGDYFLIVYRDALNDNFCSRRIAKVVPNTLETEVVIVAGTMIDAGWDCDVFNNAAAFAFNNATDITVGYIAESGDIGSPVVNGLPGSTSIPNRGRNAVNVLADQANNRIYVQYHDDTDDDVKVTAFTSDLLTSDTQDVEAALPDVRNITGTLRADASVITFYEVSTTSVKDHYVNTNTFSFNNVTVTVGTPAEFKRSVGLAAKAFTIGDDQFVTVAHESSLQSTYFTIKNDGYIITRMLSGTAGGLTRDKFNNLSTGLPRTSIDSAGRYVFPIQIRNKLTADAGGSILSTSRGIQKSALRFGVAAYNNDSLGENLHISGGILLAYDGVSATEHGFNLFPEDVELAPAAGGSLPVGQYAYRAVYEWVDGRGQIHQSAPSILEIASSAGGNNTIDVTIPTLRLTLKTFPRAECKIVIYRSQVDEVTVLYRLTETDNDPDVDSVTFSDDGSIPDTSLRVNQILYTTGGVLENIAAPASKVITKHKNRLWIAGLEDDSALWYSKEFVFGEGVAFSDFFRIQCDPRGGPITALASMDDKLVIFKRDSIYTLVGDGPVDTGAQNDFSQPQGIAGDIGCIQPESIAAIPEGLIFKSDKGIYLLTRNLGFEAIGDPVEDFDTLEVTSAVVVEDEDEVRFTTLTGSCLVYNYHFGQWSTFSNYSATSAISALGSYLHLKSDGRVRQETPGLYLDAGSRIQMAIETSWLAFAGLQGFQRVKRLDFLGDYLSDHYTRVKIAYDYEDAFTQTVYFNVDEDLDLSYYGDDATYGSSSVYGGSGTAVYQFSIKPRRQKCQSIKLRFEDVDTKTEAGGGSFNLVGLTFEVGQKIGTDKQFGGRQR
jgi:hypothetical protein